MTEKVLENDIRILQEENNKYKEKIMILKEIVATYEIDKINEYKFIEDLKRILWDKDEDKDLLNKLKKEINMEDLMEKRWCKWRTN